MYSECTHCAFVLKRISVIWNSLPDHRQSCMVMLAEQDLALLCEITKGHSPDKASLVNRYCTRICRCDMSTSGASHHVDTTETIPLKRSTKYERKSCKIRSYLLLLGPIVLRENCGVVQNGNGELVKACFTHQVRPARMGWWLFPNSQFQACCSVTLAGVPISNSRFSGDLRRLQRVDGERLKQGNQNKSPQAASAKNLGQLRQYAHCPTWTLSESG